MSTGGQRQRLNSRQRWIVVGIGCVGTAILLLVCGVYVYLFMTLDTPGANFRAYLRLLVDDLSRGEVKKPLALISLPVLIVLLAGWMGTTTVLGALGRRTLLSQAILAANETIGLIELLFVCLGSIAIVSGVVLAFVGPPFVCIPFLLCGLAIILVARPVGRWLAGVLARRDRIAEAGRVTTDIASSEANPEKKPG